MVYSKLSLYSFLLFEQESLLSFTRDAFCVQSDLFRATAVTILAIAWSLLILVVPDGMVYFNN